MSHNLKTPLNAITLLCDNCVMQHAAAQQQDHATRAPPPHASNISQIKTNVMLLEYMIDDILYYMQSSDTNAEALYISKFSMRDAINDIVKLFRVQAAQKGIQIVTEIPQQLKIENDLKKLNAVMINLISNAEKVHEHINAHARMRMRSRSSPHACQHPAKPAHAKIAHRDSNTYVDVDVGVAADADTDTDTDANKIADTIQMRILIF